MSIFFEKVVADRPSSATEITGMKDRFIWSFRNVVVQPKTPPEVSDKIKTTTIQGKSFPIFLSDQSVYFHLLVEGFLQYIFLKRYVPGLKLIIIHNFVNDSLKENSWRWKLYLDFKKILRGASIEEHLVGIDSIIFEDLRIMFFKHNEIMEGQWKPDFLEPYGSEDNPHKQFLRVSTIDIIRMIGDLPSNLSLPSKFYISRRKRNDELRSQESSWLLRRVPDVKEEDMLENELSKMGYDIISLEDYSLIDQINLFRNASQIIGLKGTGLLNMIFCSPGTEIIAINLDNALAMYYDVLADYFELPYFEIPEVVRVAAAEPGTSPAPGLVLPEYKEYSSTDVINVLRDLAYTAQINS